MTPTVLSKIIGLDKVCRGWDYRAVREAFEEEMRREVRAHILVGGLAPPETVPVAWFRVPPLVDLGDATERPEWFEEPVTDTTPIAPDDWLLARVEGVLAADEAGATVLLPVPDEAERARIGKHHLHAGDQPPIPPATVTKGFVHVEMTPEPGEPEWPS